MKVIDILTASKSTIFSFELLPPLRGGTIHSVFDAIDRLVDYSPAYINITYHRQEIVSRLNQLGETEQVRLRRRAGTVGMAAAIQNRYKIDVVPHLICGGSDATETEDELIDLDFLGFDNVFALRGDPAKNETQFTPKPGGYCHAEGLVKQIANLNRGIYISSVIDLPRATNFCIGVAGYPEKHAEAPNLLTDVLFLKQKVDAGADYVVTQLFFDNEKFFQFEKICRQAGIRVPIIPGIKPIATRKHIELLPKMFGASLPQNLLHEINRCTSDAQIYELGIEWAVAQCIELKNAGVPALHFYTMGRPDNIAKIARQIF